MLSPAPPTPRRAISSRPAHYSGIITRRDGAESLCFPRARHHLARADWDELQDELRDPESLERRTLGLARQAGLLDLVDGRRDLAGYVTIIPAPGETPGHQIVRVASEGQVLYCLGDLYHHPVEVDRPDWMVHWADRAANLSSRRMLADAALAENATLVAAHIPGCGRLRSAGGGCRWEQADR
jgi:glyoxylase-like metal-dependent hydrolase (beta-lactamase superfamily II)